MELRIAADELTRALHRAQGIAEKKTAIPILANVLIRAISQSVVFTAFDLDIGLVSEHPAEVLQEGAVTLSSKHLFEIARTLPDNLVTLKLDPNHVVRLTCGSVNMKLMGMPASDYPALPKEEDSNLVKAEGKTLVEMINMTSYAISTDETRYILNGLYFEPTERQTVRVVATDGHRLSMVERPIVSSFDLHKGVVIPRKALFELKKLVEEDSDAECFLGFGKTSAVFKKSGLSMIMRLLDGQFPEYQDVIPRYSERSIIVSRQLLLETVRLISLMSEEKSHSVRFELSEGRLRISSQNPDLGEGKEDIPISYSGPTINVGFNARYVIDVLNCIESDTVEFCLTDDQSPGVLRPPSDLSFTAVVMPMRF